MAASELLELHCGESAGFRLARVAVIGFGLMVILVAQTEWAWKMLLAATLVGSQIVLGKRAARQSVEGLIRLRRDGTAVLFGDDGSVCHAVQLTGRWITRWMSLLPLRETGSRRRRYCLVCASCNSPDSYRRLLVWSRLNPASRRHGEPVT
jgi:hypothetical protein